jgi:ribose 5-phosphate isomerase B
MRIAVGTDERTSLTDAVVEELQAAGHSVIEVAAGRAWPEVGHEVGRCVAALEVDRGIVSCTTGTGVCMAANKVAGVRAALCTDAATAAGARRWNDANVLAFGLRLTTEQVAREMITAFLTTPFDATSAAEVARVEPGDRTAP